MSGLMQRTYQAIEHFLARRFPKRISGPWRFIFRMPIWAYKFGFGWLMGSSVLLLTTTGRRSGLPRQAALGYGEDERTHELLVSAGWAGKTDWFRNLRANPQCTVQAGRTRFPAVARIWPEDEAIAHLRTFIPQNPYAPRMWSHLLGEDIGLDEESLRKVVQAFPVVGFKKSIPHPSDPASA